MVRRKTSSSGRSEPQNAYLTKPLADVAAALEGQIVKGGELLDQIDVHVFPGPGRADDVRGDFWAWHNYNATYLEKAFTTRDLRQEYEGPMIAVGMGRQTDLELIREYVDQLRQDIGKLRDIKARLPLYEPPTRQPGAGPSPAAVVPVNPHSINVTIHGQIGQLNLSDVIQHAEARIQQVDQRGEKSLADGLQHVTDALKVSNEAPEDQREDALDAVAVLAEVGALPPEERSKMRGRIRGALSVINEVAKLAPSFKHAWDAWGPTIIEYLPRLKP